MLQDQWDGSKIGKKITQSGERQQLSKLEITGSL